MDKPSKDEQAAWDGPGGPSYCPDPDPAMSKKIENCEKEVIGHALAFATYIDYIGPRPKQRHYQALLKATDVLRKAHGSYTDTDVER